MDKRLSFVSAELTVLRQTDKDLAMRVATLETTLDHYQTKWDELYRIYQNMIWLEDPALALRELTVILTGLQEKIKAASTGFSPSGRIAPRKADVREWRSGVPTLAQRV